MRRMSMRFVGIWLVIALGAGAAAAGPTPEAVANAKTAADHEAIAKAYDAEAKDLRAKAAQHRQMGKRYSKSPTFRKGRRSAGQMEAHCKRLASSLEDAAGETEGLAASHREMAKEAGK